MGLAHGPTVRVERWLSREELRLYQRQPAADRRHAQAVAAWLIARGHPDPLLVRAALLHDIGKADAGIVLYHRVIWVLVGLCGSRMRRALVGRGGPWATLHDHAAIGAARLRAICVDERLINLVSGHPLPEDVERAALLRTADDAV